MPWCTQECASDVRQTKLCVRQAERVTGRGYCDCVRAASHSYCWPASGITDRTQIEGGARGERSYPGFQAKSNFVFSILFSPNIRGAF